MNVKLENMSAKKNGFKSFIYNPIAWVIVGTALLALHAFFMQSLYIAPSEAKIKQYVQNEVKCLHNELNNIHHTNNDQNYKIDTNTKSMNDHKKWCERSLSKELDCRPTTKELEPQFKAIRDSIGKLEKTVDDSMKIIIQKLQ